MSKTIKKKLKKVKMYEEVVGIIKNEIIDKLDSEAENLQKLRDGTVEEYTLIKEAECLLDVIKHKKDKYNISYLTETVRYLPKYVDEICDMHINNYTIYLSHRRSTYHNLTYIRAWLILRTITDYIWLSPDKIEESGFKHWTIPSGWRKDETDEAIR